MSDKKYFIVMECDETNVVYEFDTEEQQKEFFARARKKLYNGMELYTDKIPKGIKNSPIMKEIVDKVLAGEEI